MHQTSFCGFVMPSMQIRGIAHPPPPRDGSRLDKSDLTAAEIAVTNISGKPLLHEHEHNSRVGTCLASWEGRDGSLRIAAEVDDLQTQQDIRQGHLRGLSLGTDLITTTNDEVSVRAGSRLLLSRGVASRPHTGRSCTAAKPS